MKLLAQGLSAAPSMRRDLSRKMKMKRLQRHGREGGFQMKSLESDAFVFFGATGDLAYEQIFPALQAMTRRGQFEIPIIGVGRSAKDLEALRARAHESIEKHGGVDERAFPALSAKLQYVKGDYSSPETFRELHKALGTASRPLYYLAIPPDSFAGVAEGLAHAESGKGARLVVEKPFGRVLSSERAHNRGRLRF